MSAKFWVQVNESPDIYDTSLSQPPYSVEVTSDIDAEMGGAHLAVYDDMSCIDEELRYEWVEIGTPTGEITIRIESLPLIIEALQRYQQLRAGRGGVDGR